MSFVEVEPRQFTPIEGLPQGTISIDRRGCCTVHREDLELVDITDAAILLVDGGTLRIALRRPRDGETKRPVKVRAVTRAKGRVDPLKAHVTLAPAIDALKLDGEAVAGRYELTTKDDLLIVNLTQE